MAVVTQIQVRRGTASQWTSTNPVLAAGEQGFETDTLKLKIGNGSSAWNSLAYVATGANGTITSITAGTGLSGGTITTTGTIAIDTATTVDVSTAQTLTNKTLTAPVINLALNAQTGTTYTFALTDNGKLVTASNASAQTYSIPTNGTTAFPVGTQINIIGIGAGEVTIQAASSGTTTVASTGATATAPKLRAQYSSATLIKASTDLWYVAGDIA
jgi:hypothetical protein